MSAHAFTVALIGLDGSGKTTVARSLERQAPERFRYVYMGDNPDSTNHGIRGIRGQRKQKRLPLLRPLRKLAGIALRMLDEGWRQRVTDRYLQRGFVVLFDRHFLADYLHGDRRSDAWGRRLQQRLRSKLLRAPDLVVILDTPAAVAFARKGEFTIEHLERRRNEYLELRSVFSHSEVVDATLPPEAVAGEVRRAIERFGAVQGGGNGKEV
jgi:thymidylate kinase